MLKRPLSCMILLVIGFMTPAVGQGKRPPVLIRDTDKAEGKEEPEATKPKEYSPLLAEQNLSVGDFYFKRKNYSAAIERYLEATEYQPNLVRAYESLARAYEKNSNAAKAILVYQDFIRKNPDSAKVAEFQAKVSKLQKLQSEKNPQRP